MLEWLLVHFSVDECAKLVFEQIISDQNASLCQCPLTTITYVL